MTKKIKVYPLYTDLMSKHIFGYQKNSKYLADMLESFFNLKKGTLKDIVITNSVKLDKETINKKQYELDIEVRLPNKDLLNIEFYSIYDENSEKKSFMYITGLFSGQLNAGEDYSVLRKQTQINFVKKDYVHQNEEAIKKYVVINTNNPQDTMLSELFQIFIVDVDINNKKTYNVREDFYKWMRFIGAKDYQEMQKIIKGCKIMEEAYKEMERFSNYESVKRHYFSLENLLANQHRTQLKKVKHETLIETAKNMLKNNFSTEDIMKATNLTKEEITKLKEQ